MVCDMPEVSIAGWLVWEFQLETQGSVYYLYDDDCLTTWRRKWCGEGASSGEMPKPGGGVWS